MYRSGFAHMLVMSFVLIYCPVFLVHSSGTEIRKAESYADLSRDESKSGGIFTKSISAATFNLQARISSVEKMLEDSTYEIERDQDSLADSVNNLPQLESIGSKVIKEGEQLKFKIISFDVESFPALEVEGMPLGANFVDFGDGTGVFDWTPAWTVNSTNTGSYVVTFYATDDSGASAYEEITIVVNKASIQGWDFFILVGSVEPQSAFSRYAEVGLGGTIRGSYHPKPVRAMGFWFDLNFIWFGTEFNTIDFNEPGFNSTAEQRISEFALSFHLGGQLGSSSRRAFFRPRVGLGPGLYIFYNTSTITSIDSFGDEETFDDVDFTSVNFGWRIIIGADFHIKNRLGLSFETVYDHVLGLDHPEGFESQKVTTRFVGGFIGVVFRY